MNAHAHTHTVISHYMYVVLKSVIVYNVPVVPNTVSRDESQLTIAILLTGS